MANDYRNTDNQNVFYVLYLQQHQNWVNLNEIWCRCSWIPKQHLQFTTYMFISENSQQSDDFSLKPTFLPHFHLLLANEEPKDKSCKLERKISSFATKKHKHCSDSIRLHTVWNRQKMQDWHFSTYCSLKKRHVR
jgi:hypothetical protein